MKHAVSDDPNHQAEIDPRYFEHAVGKCDTDRQSLSLLTYGVLRPRRDGRDDQICKTFGASSPAPRYHW